MLVVSEQQNQRVLSSSFKFLALVLGATLQQVPVPVGADFLSHLGFEAHNEGL